MALLSHGERFGRTGALRAILEPQEDSMANSKRRPQQRQHQSGNPARRATADGRPARPAAPPPSPARARLNRISAPLLIRMHAMPRWVIPVVMGLLLAGGLFLSGSLAWLGTLLLAIVTAFVMWLFAVSWPVLTPGGRVARGLVAVALLGFTFLKATGRL
jgi:hypothetical protein